MGKSALVKAFERNEGKTQESAIVRAFKQYDAQQAEKPWEKTTALPAGVSGPIAQPKALREYHKAYGQAAKAAQAEPDYGRGNIDLNAEKTYTRLKNKYSVYTDTVKGEKIIIPAFDSNGTQLDDAGAAAQYKQTGKYYAKFQIPSAVPTAQETMNNRLAAMGLSAQTGTRQVSPLAGAGGKNMDAILAERDTEVNRQIQAYLQELKDRDVDKKTAQIENGDMQLLTNLTFPEMAEIEKKRTQKKVQEQMNTSFGDADSSFLSSLGLATVSGLQNYQSGIQGVVNGGRTDVLSGAVDSAIKAVATRERMQMDSVEGVVFDFVQNLVQNAPSMALGMSGSSFIGSASIFASSYGNDLKYAKAAGYDARKAHTYAFLDGLNQAFLDKLGSTPGIGGVTNTVAENLTKNVSNAFLRFVSKIAIDVAGEGIEEMVQTAVENGLKNAVFGEKNNASLFSEEALYSAFLGALSGGVINTVTMGVSSIGNKNNEISPEVREAVREMLVNHTVETAVGYGVEENVYRDIARVSGEIGVPIRFAANEDMAVTNARGEVSYAEGRYDYNPETGTGTVVLNQNITAERANHFLLKHELTHAIEGTKEWDSIVQYIRNEMGEASFEEAKQNKTQEYASKGIELDDGGALREVVADWVGNNLYSGGFVSAVLNSNTEAGSAMQRAFTRLRSAFSKQKNSRPVSQTGEMERLFRKGVDRRAVWNGGAAPREGSQYWINPNFENEYAAWDKKSSGGYFWIGSTSRALESVGINPSKIYWDKSKILDILQNPEHYMEDAITQVPELLEHPIIIMQSLTVPNRVVVLGDIYDNHGNPVLCALELTPKGNIQNLIKVASAYGKESGLQSQINESDILYIDPNKNRTDSWLQARRLQLPVGVTKYGPIGRVTLLKQNVKGEFEVGSDKATKTPMQIAFEEAQKRSTNNKDMQNGGENSQFSFGEDTTLSAAPAVGTSLDEGGGAVSLGMTEQQRYEKLKDRTIVAVEDRSSEIEDLSLEELENRAKSKAETVIYPLAEKLGILGRELSTPELDIGFELTKGNGLKASLSHQLKYGGSYADFAKALINLDAILQNAVLVEMHTDKYKGTVRESINLLDTAVLVGVYEEGEFIVPVQFEVKRLRDSPNKLYLVVAMTKIEADVMGVTSNVEGQSTRNLISASTYRIADIFKNINPRDAEFLKYTPDGFLNDEQKVAKQTALAAERQRIDSYPKKKQQFSFGGVNGTDINVPYEGELTTPPPSDDGTSPDKGRLREAQTRGVEGLAAARSPRGFDSPPDCHSLPLGRQSYAAPYDEGTVKTANSQAVGNLDETAEVQGAVFAYQQAYKNDDILQLVQKVKEGKHKDNEFVSFGMIDERTARRIQEITGIDVTGWKVEIEARQISHILKDHGENGLTDRSLANENDIAKMEYAIRNAEHIADGGTTSAYFNFVEGKNRRSKTILYQKQIGDQYYYVVEAVPQTKKKTLQIVGAFINKNKKIEGSYLTDAKSPDATSNDVGMTPSTDTANRINGLERPKPNEGYALENDVSTHSIRNPEENVKDNSSTGFADVEVQPQEIPEGTTGATETVYREERITPDAVRREAAKKAAAASRERIVARGRTFEEIAQELSPETLFNRVYISGQIDPTDDTVEIDGVEIDSEAYMEAVEQLLPDNEEGLRTYIKDVGEQYGQAVIENMESGTGKMGVALPVDLEMLAAERKLERILLSDENGTALRQFYEKRLMSMDANQTHQQEWLDYIAGRRETYSPIANQTVMNHAIKELWKPQYTEDLRRRILLGDPLDTFNAVDIAAAQLLVNNARTAGEIEEYDALLRGLSKKGTALGRAVQLLSMQRKLTPEGTIRAARRTLEQAADARYGDGTSNSVDELGGKILDGIDTVKSRDADLGAATTEELRDALADRLIGQQSPYITPEQIRKILNKAVGEATNLPWQLRKMLKTDDIQMKLAEKIALIEKEGHLNDATMRRALEEALGLPTLSNEDITELVRLVNEMNAQQENTLAWREAAENVYSFLGGKLPSTFQEALMTWRKFAMLANPKTHFRNFTSNAAMYGINKVDDAIATFLQQTFIREPAMRDAYVIWRGTTHGKQLAASGALQEAAEKAIVRMRGSEKYELSSGQLSRYKNPFYALPIPEKAADIADKLNRKNSEWMENEDEFFFKNVFMDKLGQVMTVRKLTEVTDDVFEIALNRAEEAVFRSENSVSKVLKKLKSGMFDARTSKGKKALGYIADIVIPFSKTPSNIAVSSFQHSPLGMVKSAYDLTQKLRRKSTKETADIINSFSKNITGALLMGIGLLLGSLGLFNTGYGKTEKERAADELAGIQENSLVIGDISFTLDWLQPSASPLIVGASIAQRLREDGLSLSAIGGAVMDGTDSLFELTMLQSLYDVLGGYDAGASASAASIAENVVSQSIPTLLGQAARAIDPVQRKTRGDNDFETIVNQIMAKVPGLTYLLEPEMDVWGNEVYRTGKASVGNAFLNAVQQFILPFNYKQGTGADDHLSRAVLELYNSGTDKSSRAIPTSVTRDEAREMGVDYDELFRIVAQMQREKVEELMDDKVSYSVQSKGANGKKRTVQKRWSQMTEDEQLRVMNRVYSDVKSSATDPDEAFYDEIIGRLRYGS